MQIRGPRQVCYNPSIEARLTIYGVVQYAVAASMFVSLTRYKAVWGAPLIAMATVFVLATFTTISWIFENRYAD